MTTVTMFSRQNDAASRASATYYWENVVLLVVLVLESKVSSTSGTSNPASYAG